MDFNKEIVTLVKKITEENNKNIKMFPISLDFKAIYHRVFYMQMLI